MEQAKKGDKVKVHYTGKLTNGEQFDSSKGREPLEFTVGAGQMIKGFDDAMPGMKVGEKKTINILPADAYGEKDEHAIIEFPKEN
ncbi:MAG: FKBP-type peptidyl-prolyl cis-trans isomerase, partial [Bacteroidota bacterium]|nr:FKBP-type peptidyl-prolyl cis-trans isomerase [Bacteroidota bacterium]